MLYLSISLYLIYSVGITVLDSPSVLKHREVYIATHIYNAPDNSQEPKVLKLSLSSPFPFSPLQIFQ